MEGYLAETTFGCRLLHEGTGKVVGMMVVLTLQDYASARYFVRNEPYFLAGLTETYKINRIERVT
jgi:hypothetical protein